MKKYLLYSLFFIQAIIVCIVLLFLVVWAYQVYPRELYRYDAHKVANVFSERNEKLLAQQDPEALSLAAFHFKEFMLMVGDIEDYNAQYRRYLDAAYKLDEPFAILEYACVIMPKENAPATEIIKEKKRALKALEALETGRAYDRLSLLYSDKGGFQDVVKPDPKKESYYRAKYSDARNQDVNSKENWESMDENGD